ncbi:hypothetical protein [Streptomyces huiliensis]|uniref:hypothetical protein n=1 Tax=Streptomyces huiliensis TaxID=2876027 RepID=UPI0021DFCB38|nr:hypothetical protein [Streptomyces huiliensis]MBZ4321050.1 hypothetical protein [Streptomyces huiliensis]
MTEVPPGKRRRAGRAQTAAVLSLAAAHLALVPPSAHAADPAGCTRDGTHITCTNGLPEGQTLTGTGGNDTIEITGTVHGTVDGAGGADTITIRGRRGARGHDTVRRSGGRAGQGEHAVGDHGSVLGGDGNDVITLIGGDGGRGGDVIEGSRVRAGHGGTGGFGLDGGTVDGGRGINLITVRGGNGGVSGANLNGSGEEAGYAGSGGDGIRSGHVIVGTDQHSSLIAEGGDGASAPLRAERAGPGGTGVSTARLKVGPAPGGVSIRFTGGDSGFGGHHAMAGGSGMYFVQLVGTPGDDDIRLEGGSSHTGGVRGRGLNVSIVKTGDGDDIITADGSSSSIDCGEGNDTYTYRGRRGTVSPTCEHISRSQ